MGIPSVAGLDKLRESLLIRHAKKKKKKKRKKENGRAKSNLMLMSD